jgi:hypothetical protein
MPAFGIAQSGGFGPPNQGLNVTCVQPGEELTLFDGTETVALNLASIDFARGTMGSGDNGSTFNLTGIPTGMTVDVQACSPPAGGFASTAAKDKAFTSLVTLSPDANGNASYTDIGRSAFYRYKISAYTSGTMPVGVVQR